MADQQTSPSSDGGGPSEDVKAKFREALEKKKRRDHPTAPGASHDGSEKSHGATGATGAQRFQRKSGPSS